MLHRIATEIEIQDRSVKPQKVQCMCVLRFMNDMYMYFDQGSV